MLLELPLEQEHYSACLEAAALLPDLEAMSHGDQTPAGDRGSALSGGQRSRLALARALYLVHPPLPVLTVTISINKVAMALSCWHTTALLCEAGAGSWRSLSVSVIGDAPP